MPLSFALFQITEYEQVGYPPTLRFVYQSGSMGLRDASLFAGTLSYARGEYISVIAVDPFDEPYYEWWFAGRLWSIGRCPPLYPEHGGFPDPPERLSADRMQELLQGDSLIKK